MTQVQTRPTTTSSQRLAGKVALVTGGARGIGAAIALKLASEGASVVVNYNSSKTAAEQLVAKIQEHGVKGTAVQADLSKENEAAKLIAEIQRLGRLDILVNNAAIFEGGPIDQVDVAQYERVFDTNVKGVVAATIAALPHLKEGGRIINITSVAARAKLPGFSFYAASKAALEGLTRNWAQDLGKRGITVNAVAPGTTQTDMLEKGIPAEVQQSFIDKTALGRIGQPVDIAEVVAFLASPESQWVTGQSIDADGGLIA